MTFGIGSASSALFSNFYSQATFQALAHGTFQGGMTAISGGKFWSGFAAGALSSIASSAWSGGTTTDTHFQANSGLTDGHFVTDTFSHQGLSGALGMNNAVGMIAFGTVAGGAGAALTGGNFWQGAVTGLVVSGLNHSFHKEDNGYDQNGNEINKNGGDTTDYLYDNEGNITDSTPVKFRGAIPSSGGPLRGYGFKGFAMASGAITQDNTIFELYAGGEALSLAGKGFNAFTGGLKQWFRVGSSYSIEGGFKTVSLRWGAGGNYWKKIGSEYLQGVNKSLRQMKISFDSWRTADPGHFHLWKK